MKNKLALLSLVTVALLQLSTVSARASGGLTVDYWQSCPIEGGVVLTAKIAQGDNDTLIAAGLGAVVVSAMGCDIFPIKMKFSNSGASTLIVTPSTFRAKAQEQGQSYALAMFLAPENGRVAEWSSVRMPPGSSIELYGYYVAPVQFQANTLSWN